MDQVKCGKGIESLYNIIEGTYSRKCLINNQTLDINIVKNQDSEDSVQWKIIKTEKKMMVMNIVQKAMVAIMVVEILLINFS